MMSLRLGKWVSNVLKYVPYGLAQSHVTWVSWGPQGIKLDPSRVTGPAQVF